MGMIGIYKITSPTNKIYIGQSIDIDKRKHVYKSIKCVDQPKIYNSLIKYGWNSHQHEIIEECTKEQLDEREIYWGTYYNVLGEDGLNLKIGNGRGSWSEESKQKMKKPITQSHKDKIGIANRKPKPDGFKEICSKPKTKEHANNISKAKLGKTKPKEFGDKIALLKSKPIQQLTLDGILLNEFNSIKDANIYLGKSSQSIARACRGQRNKAFGYIWKFKNQN